MNKQTWFGLVFFIVAGTGLIWACVKLGTELDNDFDKLLQRPAVECKVCHCGKISCHRECSEENMCAMRCEALCQKGQ